MPTQSAFIAKPLWTLPLIEQSSSYPFKNPISSTTALLSECGVLRLRDGPLSLQLEHSTLSCSTHLWMHWRRRKFCGRQSPDAIRQPSHPCRQVSFPCECAQPRTATLRVCQGVCLVEQTCYSLHARASSRPHQPQFVPLSTFASFRIWHGLPPLAISEACMWVALVLAALYSSALLPPGASCYVWVVVHAQSSSQCICWSTYRACSSLLDHWIWRSGGSICYMTFCICSIDF